MNRLITFLQQSLSRIAISAILVELLLAPATVEATCGDYLMQPGTVAHGTVSNRGNAFHNFADENHSSRDAHRENGRSPIPDSPTCQGSRCSNGSLPLPADLPWVSSPLDHWAIISNDQMLGHSQSSSSWLFGQCLPLTDGCYQGIFHPPR
jgi:hypothetical protein